MSTSIIATKLYIPTPPPTLIPREQLMQRLDRGLGGQLTLVSALAGSGKSTVITDWVAHCQRPVAWLALDANDSDPQRFMVYLVTALQTITPQIGEHVLAVLASPQPPPSESLLTALVNTMAAIPDPFVLVLDDYHLIDNPSVDNALNFILEHQPPQMHMVIITREDPPLPLARLRARGKLTELRTADLRFSTDETADFFNRLMGLDLSAHEIATLETRTEGWIAGMQLAALSIHNQPDIEQFLQSFTGTHHFVLDYLAEEVLRHQPEAVRNFLLQTSILDRLCGALCDAVLGDTPTHSEAMLHHLQQANLFLIPLDNKRHWYRYHHLFGDLLRQRLQQTNGADITELHRRASLWYEAHGLTLEAFHHAVAANDIARAEQCIFAGGVPLYLRGGITPIINWLASLPPSVLDEHPSLRVMDAFVLMITGQQIDTLEDRLQAAENALASTDDTPNKRDLLGQIAAVRGMLAGPKQDLETMLHQSEQALALLHPDNLPIRTMAGWSKGLAHQYRGERAAAREVYAKTAAISKSTDNSMMMIAAFTCLGQVDESDTQLHVAAQSYREVVEIVGDPPWNAACEAYLGLGRIHYQWNQLDHAREYAQQGLKLSQQIENVDTPIECCVLLAQIDRAEGDHDHAAIMLKDAARFVHQRNFAPRMGMVIAEQVRLLLAHAQVDAASQLLADNDLPFSRARVYLAAQQTNDALAILATYHQQMTALAWHDEQLKALVLLALAHAQNHDPDQALATLTSALTQAAPNTHIRLFVDEGEPMRQLLAAIKPMGIIGDYTEKLLAAFGNNAHVDAPPRTPSQPLIEPLSDREVEVLQLIAHGLTNQEIAAKLYLSLHTVKVHARNIYGKLAVKNRTQAVARGRELGILSYE